MNSIFIDADAFVAVADNNDPNHEKAVRSSRLLKKSFKKLYTSNFTFGEAVTVISQNVGHQEALIWIDEFLKSDIQIERSGSQRELEALEIFKKAVSKNTRFTDCLNMVIMQELGIDTIFSFDKHYKKAGFKRYGVD